ncbi:MAG: acetoacetate--CoA ligase [Jatrophihabitantaceae bacterium]
MTSTPAPDPIWTPDPITAAAGQLERFRAFVDDRHALALTNYAELHAWSVVELDAFWLAVWDFFGVQSATLPTVALADARMPGAQWFPGVQLNYVAQIMRNEPNERAAIIDLAEDGRESVVTWAQLHRQVGAVAATLRGLGVGPGDRVVGYLPNIAAAIVAFLATASIGAIWSACGQDYAAKGAADRFSQLEPTVLFAADGYLHNGTAHDRRDETIELIGRLPSLRAVVAVDHLHLPTFDAGPVRVLTWTEATATDAELQIADVPFEHPLWVLFTSGTTGTPKGIVHGHGGVVLEHLAMLGLQSDLSARDTFFWYTTTNWMMWNMVVSGLLVGATVIAYDGSPLAPTADALWRIVERHGVTVFGTSPGHLLASEKAGLHPGVEHDLSRLRAIGSTGATLPVSAFHWVREQVGEVQLGSTSGGTDLVGAFVGSAATVPVWPGEISAISLGVALEVWDSAGNPVVGEVGELVVTKPIPSMPLFFWNDPDGERYHDAYFSTFPGVWRHGDWITLTDRGSVIVHGRSDSTLNRNGVRLGSADIYDAIEQLPEIAEALVIGVEEGDGGYWMPLFVVLADGAELDDGLRTRIKEAIRANASPRHVPDEVIAVRAIPHTRTGKKIEVPVKRVLQGASAVQALSLGAVDDPSLIEVFAEIGRQHRSADSAGAKSDA